MAKAKVIDRADLEAAKRALVDTIAKKRDPDASPEDAKDTMMEILMEVLEKLDALIEKTEAAEEEGQPLSPDDLTEEEKEIAAAGSDIRHNRLGSLLGRLDAIFEDNGADGE